MLSRTARVHLAWASVMALFIAGAFLYAGLGLLWAWLGAINAVVITLYGLDKSAAQRGGWRVPEGVLHICALCGGSPAAFAAQRLFRHKTAKADFQRIFIAIIVLQAIAVGFYFWRLRSA